MTLREEISAIKEIEETTDAVKHLIKEEGVLTGSMVWGVGTKDSDIDVLIAPNAFLNYADVMTYHNGVYLHENEDLMIQHYRENGFESLYVLAYSEIYNLLFFNCEQEYIKWVRATRMMHRTIAVDNHFKVGIKDKEYRVECFEKFKHQVGIE